MNEELNINITSDEMLDKTIDTYGEMLDKIEELKAGCDVYKRILEKYATENRIRSHSTERYTLKMAKMKPALKRSPDVQEKDVVALLKKNEATRDFIVTTYDANALKAAFGNDDEGIERLASLGLFLTEPKNHIIVKARCGKS